MDNIIEIKNLTKKFKNKIALDNVSFSVKKGAFHGFIGNNGAGKTTTFRSILGFYPDVSGEVTIDGISFKDYKSRKNIGYIPEVAIFPKKIKIKEYIYHFAEFSGLSKDKALQKTNELLKDYGFDTKEFNKSANNLSSGQKKKVLLMQALVNDPEILILDEPAANLDPSARIELYEILKKLHAQGKTIFISSHILLELEKYIDSFTILGNGRVIETIDNLQEKLKSIPFNKQIIFNEKTDLTILEESIKPIFKEYAIEKNILQIYIEDQNALNKLLNLIIKNELIFTEIKDIKLNLNKMYFSTNNSE